MVTKQLDEISEAEASIEEAEAAIAKVEQGILDGDPSATAAALIDAEGELGKRRGLLARAKELRQQRREREAEAERLQRVADMESLLAEHFGKHEGDLVDLFDEAVARLSPFVAAAVERNAQLGVMREEIRALEPLPRSMLIHNDGTISAHGARIGLLDVQALVAEVAVRALLSAGVNASTLEKQAATSRNYESFEHYGVERGGHVGPSNHLRNLARTVAGDPPPPHIPKPRQERATAIIIPDGDE